MNTQGAASRNRKPRNKSVIEPVMMGVDLDAMLAEKVLLPAPVTLKGKTYMVRTDLTSPEVTLYLRLVAADKELEGYQLLLGAEEGKQLQADLHTLPRIHQRLVSREILLASRALADFAMSEEDILGGKPGES